MSRALPILFNTDMVLAILDGRKTVTRRLVRKSHCTLLVKREPSQLEEWGETYPTFDGITAGEIMESSYRPPYKPGDILYVRETWCEWTGGYLYKAWAEGLHQPGAGGLFKWSPSIHMPKEAARIWLRITDVRADRLQDMSTDDFLAEGVIVRPEAFNDPENAYQQAKEEFIHIWDSTISKEKKDLYCWGADPWVWVIEFERCEKPENWR